MSENKLLIVDEESNILEFLKLLDESMTNNPELIVPMDEELFAEALDLVKDVDID